MLNRAGCLFEEIFENQECMKNNVGLFIGADLFLVQFLFICFRWEAT